MKKLTVLILAIALVCPLAFGQTQVLSRNAVGYVKVTVASNGYNLVRIDFEGLGDDTTVSNVIGEQLPNGSFVHIWDRSLKTYVSVQKPLRGGAWGANVLNRGDAFWLRVPGLVATSNEYTVFLMGEVPDTFGGGGTSSIPNLTGIDAIGYAYPAEIRWVDTELASNAPNGAFLHVWNGSNYLSYQKPLRGGWPSAASNVVLHPGQAFWYRPGSSVTQTWTETKPYTWPP